MSNLCLGTSVICYIIMASKLFWKQVAEWNCAECRKVKTDEDYLVELRFTLKVVQKTEFNRNDAYVRSLTVLSMATVNWSWKSPRGAQTEAVVYPQYDIALRMKLGKEE